MCCSSFDVNAGIIKYAVIRLLAICFCILPSRLPLIRRYLKKFKRSSLIFFVIVILLQNSQFLILAITEQPT